MRLIPQPDRQCGSPRGIHRVAGGNAPGKLVNSLPTRKGSNYGLVFLGERLAEIRARMRGRDSASASPGGSLYANRGCVDRSVPSAGLLARREIEGVSPMWDAGGLDSNRPQPSTPSTYVDRQCGGRRRGGSGARPFRPAEPLVGAHEGRPYSPAAWPHSPARRAGSTEPVSVNVDSRNAVRAPDENAHGKT